MVAASYELNHLAERQRQNGFATTDYGEIVNDIMETHGQEALEQFGLGSWELDSERSTEQFIVLEKGGETQIVFRGRAGINVVDEAHLWAAAKGQPRDYSELDELIENLRETRPNSRISVTSYSNGGPKGMYVADKYNLPHYTIDPVLGPREIEALASRTEFSPPLEIVTTTRPAAASMTGTTLQEIITGHSPENTEFIQVEPYEAPSYHPIDLIEDPHDLRHYSNMDENGWAINEAERVRPSLIGRNVAGNLIASTAPIALASFMVEGTAPNQQKDVKLGETAALGAILQQGISPLIGGGEAAAAELVLPLFTSLEAADKTAQAMDDVLPDDMDYADRQVLIGTAAGGTAGGTFAATAAGVTVAKNAAKQVIKRAVTSVSTTSAEAEGYEMVAMDEAVAESTVVVESTAAEAAFVATEVEAGTEMTALLGAEGGTEAALVLATEVTAEAAASELFLNPVLDTIMVGTLTAAAVGATVGLITGQHEHYADARKTPEEMADENTAYANSITRLVENNGESNHFLPYVTDLLKRQRDGQTSREEDATIAMLQAHRRNNPGVFSRDIGAALDTYVPPAYVGDRQNGLQDVLISRHQQLRDTQKSQQMELRGMLEASRDHPETLSIEDAHTLTHTRAQYENGTLEAYMSDIVAKHDAGFWSSDREDQPEIQPAADFSSLAVGASEDTVVLHESG